MRRTLVSLGALALAASCGGLLDVTLGAGVLPTIDVDRAYALGPADLAACPAGDHDVADPRTGETLTVTVAPTDTGCALTFQENGVLLFDEAQARQASDKLQGREIQGVKSVAIVVESFSLEDQDGGGIDLATRVSAAEITVDGQTLLTRDDLLTLPGEVRKEISGPLLQKVIDGVESGTPVRVDVAARLEIPSAGMQDLPSTLHLQTQLQPEVELDVAETISGAAG